MTDVVHFDDYFENYDAALASGLSATGESKDFFARGRVSWLAGCLEKLADRPSAAMDFGCGIGSTTPHLLAQLTVDSVLGLDVSAKCIEMAKQKWSSVQIHFMSPDEYVPAEEIDLVYTSGVFHHIPKADRVATLEFIQRALRPGGYFAFWENNPWNPGTRYVMNRCEFDRDAITLAAPGARTLLRSAGFEIVRTDFLFIFPGALRWLRPLEPMLSGLPFGGQYQVLCRKPRQRSSSPK